MSTKFDQRDDPSVTRNYGALIIELASIVPDGIVCFFTRFVLCRLVVEAATVTVEIVLEVITQVKQSLLNS